MLGELNEQQIEDMLATQVTGRIACNFNGIPYIAPVNYVYDGKQIISHSTPGKKIDMMRKNPRICFQVDEIKSIFNWQSVIAWGRFEERAGNNGSYRTYYAVCRKTRKSHVSRVGRKRRRCWYQAGPHPL